MPSRPETLAGKILFCPPYTRARWMALLPLMNSTPYDTAYLGGIEIIMCT